MHAVATDLQAVVAVSASALGKPAGHPMSEPAPPIVCLPTIFHFGGSSNLAWLTVSEAYPHGRSWQSAPLVFPRPVWNHAERILGDGSFPVTPCRWA